MLLALVTAFFFYKVEDESVPYGTREYFNVTSIAGSLNKGDTIELLELAAQDNHVNIYKVMADPANVGHSRLLFSFVGDSASYRSYLGAGDYPYFSASYKTTIYSHTRITTQDMRGGYYTTADDKITSRIIEALRENGITASIEQGDRTYVYDAAFGNTPLMPILVAALMGLLLAIGYSTTYHRKIYTIKSLHGYGDSRILLGEVGALSRFYAISASIILVVGAMFLVWYNQLHQISSFGLYVAIALLVLYIFLIGSQLLAFAIRPQSHAIQILKGQRPLAFLGILSCVVQAVMLVLIFSVLSSTMQNFQSTRADQKQYSHWLDAREYVSLRFSSTLSENDFQAFMPRFGSLFRSQEKQGHAVLSYHPVGAVGDTEQIGPGTGNSMIVNNPFLRQQTVVSESGQRIVDLPESSDRMYLLVPVTDKLVAEGVRKQYEQWASFQIDQQMHENNRYKIDVTVLYTKAGQDIFNYGGTFLMDGMSQRDPIIAVVPAASKILSSDFYVSSATQGSILFSDAQEISAQLHVDDLDKYILSIDTVSDYALSALDQRLVELRLEVLSILIAFSVLALSSTILASVYCDRNKQALFIKYIHGWSFHQTHAVYLILNLGGGSVLLLIAACAGRIVSISGYIAALSVLGANFAFSAVVVQSFQRQFRGDFIKRY